MDEFSQKFRKSLITASRKAYDYLEVFDTEFIKIRQVHEDGVSSILLKEIAKLDKDDFFVKIKSLDVNEKLTGLDFDLWIGENDNSYIRLNVQAKSFGNQINVHNKYTICKIQCDKIINHSQNSEHKAFPMYFLYQHIIDEQLKSSFFNFLEDFEEEQSSITTTSAYNIKKLCESDDLKFSDIHQNKLDNRWNNNIYEVFEKNDERIGLPLYCLYDLCPSRIEKFNNLISTKKNSAKFFFFFFPYNEPFFESYKISAAEIEKRYGQNDPNSDIQVKTLIIINDKNKLYRERIHKINKFLKESETAL